MMDVLRVPTSQGDLRLPNSFRAERCVCCWTTAASRKCCSVPWAYRWPVASLCGGTLPPSLGAGQGMRLWSWAPSRATASCSASTDCPSARPAGWPNTWAAPRALVIARFSPRNCRCLWWCPTATPNSSGDWRTTRPTSVFPPRRCAWPGAVHPQARQSPAEPALRQPRQSGGAGAARGRRRGTRRSGPCGVAAALVQSDHRRTGTRPAR